MYRVGWAMAVQRVRLNGTKFADTLVGEADLLNTIYAGAGDDRLIGGRFADILAGEAGRDTIDGGHGADSVWGGGADDRVNGGSGNDYLAGDGGHDVLDGGTGDDRLVGGTGNDTFYVDSAGDLVFEASGHGLDTIYTSASLTMAANIENLFVTTGSRTIIGNGLSNIIREVRVLTTSTERQEMTKCTAGPVTTVSPGLRATTR